MRDAEGANEKATATLNR